jgi:Flp pilus assembly protein TadG
VTRAVSDRGAAAAELAVALPAVIVVVVLCVSALAGAGRQVRLEQAAAQAARSAARGEPSDRVLATAAAVLPAVRISIRKDGDVVCIDARVAPGVPLLPELQTTACAAAGGL